MGRRQRGYPKSVSREPSNFVRRDALDSSVVRLYLPKQQEGEGKEQADGGGSAPKDPMWTLWKRLLANNLKNCIGLAIGLEAK